MNYAHYNNKIESLIANTSEVFYDEETKRDACNSIITRICQGYDVPGMIVRDTVQFTSGVATIPADYSRMVKIWESSGGVELHSYIYTEPDIFDQLATLASYYWTEDYVTGSGLKFLIKPVGTIELDIRYVRTPTEMLDSTTDSGLGGEWDDAVVYGAVAILYQGANRYDEAREHERIFGQRVAEIYSATKNRGGVKSGTKFKSIYERVSQLN